MTNSKSFINYTDGALAVYLADTFPPPKRIPLYYSYSKVFKDKEEWLAYLSKYAYHRYEEVIYRLDEINNIGKE